MSWELFLSFFFSIYYIILLQNIFFHNVLVVLGDIIKKPCLNMQ